MHCMALDFTHIIKNITFKHAAAAAVVVQLSVVPPPAAASLPALAVALASLPPAVLQDFPSPS